DSCHAFLLRFCCPVSISMLFTWLPPRDRQQGWRPHYYCRAASPGLLLARPTGSPAGLRPQSPGAPSACVAASWSSALWEPALLASGSAYLLLVVGVAVQALGE